MVKQTSLAVAALSAFVAAAYPAPYAADVSTPEKRAAKIEQLWTHDKASDVRIWPAERLKPEAVQKPFSLTEWELDQSNLVIGDVLNPQFSVFPAKGEGRCPAVLVFPGGGYHVLGWNKEGTEIAEWLNSLGFAAFVLLYRTDDRDGALADAQRTMGILRRDAAKYGIDPARLGVIGFSAGANLAVRLSTNWRSRTYEKVDDADDQPCRPDFMLPIYPWDIRPRLNPTDPWKGWEKTMALAKEYPVDSQTPPSFTIQSIDDMCEAETAVALDFVLRRAGVQSEIRIYPSGGHGYGLRRLGKPTDVWSYEAASWLARFAGPASVR
ncbi:MAG: alpha/beta hydrolase [Kiritimatiellae bacterium]|nr:alpha/beta hydrolase [Kiritimatiellia bacterium]